MSTVPPPADPSAPSLGSADRTGVWLDHGVGWMVLACALLLVGGGWREIQSRQIQRERSVFEACPFPLESIPHQFGDWVSNPSDTEVLDDLTIRITGSTDRFIRRYTNQFTGVGASVLVLYGPAEPVLPHTPTICFPATGYSLDGSIGYTTIKVAGKDAGFRTATYSKNVGLQSSRVRSYYSFRLDGQWSPDAGSGRRFYRSNPGIFKVQVQRDMRRDEKIAANDPLDDFIAKLLTDIESRIAASGKGSTSVAQPATTVQSTREVRTERDADRSRAGNPGTNS